MVAHHGYELGVGVGLVFQPEFGLLGAVGLWLAAGTSWSALARSKREGGDAVLAALAGASLAGALVHFVIWPFEWRAAAGIGVLPYLTSAEGMSERHLVAYNRILQAWAVASAIAIVAGTPRAARRWALIGLAAGPAFYVSARRHFAWLQKQAAADPAWWNRAVAVGKDVA